MIHPYSDIGFSISDLNKSLVSDEISGFIQSIKSQFNKSLSKMVPIYENVLNVTSKAIGTNTFSATLIRPWKL